MRNTNNWSEEKIKFLENNYLKLTDKELAEFLKTTKKSVEAKRQSLGLLKKKYSKKIPKEVINEIIHSDLCRKDAIAIYTKKFNITSDQVGYIYKKHKKSNKQKKWTEDEIKFLVNNKEMDNVELSKILNRSPGSVASKRFKLGIFDYKHVPIRDDYWTDADIKFLRENINFLDTGEIAKQLNRTKKAVDVQATRMKLIKYQSIWSAGEEEVLKKYSNLSIYSLCHILEKTPRSIEHKARELGIDVRKREKMTVIEKAIEKILIDLKCDYSSFVILGEEFKYEADFVVGKKVIEVNGDYWHGNPSIFTNLNAQQEVFRLKDKLKKEYFESLGYEVFYVWEYDIHNNYNEVCNYVASLIRNN